MLRDTTQNTDQGKVIFLNDVFNTEVLETMSSFANTHTMVELSRACKYTNASFHDTDIGVTGSKVNQLQPSTLSAFFADKWIPLSLGAVAMIAGTDFIVNPVIGAIAGGLALGAAGMIGCGGFFAAINVLSGYQNKNTREIVDLFVNGALGGESMGVSLGAAMGISSGALMGLYLTLDTSINTLAAVGTSGLVCYGLFQHKNQVNDNRDKYFNICHRSIQSEDAKSDAETLRKYIL